MQRQLRCDLERAGTRREIRKEADLPIHHLLVGNVHTAETIIGPDGLLLTILIPVALQRPAPPHSLPVSKPPPEPSTPNATRVCPRLYCQQRTLPPHDKIQQTEKAAASGTVDMAGRESTWVRRGSRRARLWTLTPSPPSQPLRNRVEYTVRSSTYTEYMAMCPLMMGVLLQHREGCGRSLPPCWCWCSSPLRPVP